jgi:hypothetical protein
MIIKIYEKRGKNKKSRGQRRRGLTLAKIVVGLTTRVLEEKMSKKEKKW